MSAKVKMLKDVRMALPLPLWSDLAERKGKEMKGKEKEGEKIRAGGKEKV